LAKITVLGCSDDPEIEAPHDMSRKTPGWRAVDAAIVIAIRICTIAAAQVSVPVYGAVDGGPSVMLGNADGTNP